MPAQPGRTKRCKEGEWSLGEIPNHLVLGERDVILPRLKRMVREEAPIFPSSAATRTGFAAEPRSRDFGADLAEFRRIREETVSFLQNLPDSDWERIGTTPTRGTLTIEAYARYLTQHDLEHLVQFEATRAVPAERPLY
ncbi:MAG: DinB family protein [Candidatus Rokubacteria bacterium]|nr:DinB family protein [Candidatus Rokubacteria bacterium]